MRYYIFFFFLLLTISTVITLWYFKRDLFSKKNLDTIVAFMTIATGIASVIVGFVTIKVMLDQNNREQTLLEFQEKEHQPVFIVKKTVGISDETKNIYDYEEFTLENVGHKYKYLKEVTIETFIQINHMIARGGIKRITSYIPLEDYYYTTSKTGDVSGLVYYSSGSNKYHNNKIFSDIYRSATEYNKENELIYVGKIEFFIIKYIDIYDKERVIYLQDKEIVTEDIYNNIKTLAEQDYGYKTYNLSELSLDIYWNERRKQ